MLIGIHGRPEDPHCQAVGAAVSHRGVECAFIDSRAPLAGLEYSFDGRALKIGGDEVPEASVWFLRHTLAPYAKPNRSSGPDFTDSWLRAQSGLQLAWLQLQSARGVPVVNKPWTGSGRPKPLQLALAGDLGLRVPRTLVTNSVDDVIEFADAVGALIEKPLDAGICSPLDLDAWRSSRGHPPKPVIVQERISGTNVRATITAAGAVSSVEIPTDELDYRQDAGYIQGKTKYRITSLPDSLVRDIRRFMTRCELLFAGVDLIRTDEDQYVFLEANSSPMWLDIEHKTGQPITSTIAELLILVARKRSEPKP